MKITGSDKVLVDTSIWIEYFRGKEPAYSLVAGLMDERRICLIGLILAELIQGARSEKEIAVLLDFLQVFEFFPENPALWAKAGRLSNSLRQKGKTIGLADCFIAVMAHDFQAMLYSRDEHFRLLSKEINLKLYSEL